MVRDATWFLAAAFLFTGAAGAADQAAPPVSTHAADHAHQEEASADTAVTGRDDDCDGVDCASQSTPQAQSLAIKQKGLPGKSSSKKENEAAQKQQ